MINGPQPALRRLAVTDTGARRTAAGVAMAVNLDLIPFGAACFLAVLAPVGLPVPSKTVVARV